jgi:hypothetical protein
LAGFAPGATGATGATGPTGATAIASSDTFKWTPPVEGFHHHESEGMPGPVYAVPPAKLTDRHHAVELGGFFDALLLMPFIVMAMVKAGFWRQALAWLIPKGRPD